MSLVSVADFEKEANQRLSNQISQYYSSGAGTNFSVHLNSSAFDRIRLRPRVMRDVSHRDTSCSLLGLNLRTPICLSPSALHSLAHPDAEIATARAAATSGTLMTLSTFSSKSIEEVGRTEPGSPKWLQFFIYQNRDLTREFLRRAENAGFHGLVLTVDTPILTSRRHYPPYFDFGNFESVEGNDLHSYTAVDASATWEDLKWLKALTKLPLILKGILTPEDAVLAVEHGADGILVSNHGARNLDTVPATIEVLPEIVRAVGHRTTVMLDGGVRQGTDVFKALALGAKAVFVGRPVLWGLAVDGQRGVEGVLEVLRKELDITMALCGCSTLTDIKREMVAHETKFCKL